MARAGRTSQNPDRYGYHEHTERVDSLLDEVGRLQMLVQMLEAQRDVSVVETDICQKMMASTAARYVKLLFQCEGREYVLAQTILDILIPEEDIRGEENEG